MMKKQIRLFGRNFLYRVRIRRRVRRVRRTSKLSRQKYLAHKEAARILARERTEHFRKIYAARGYVFKVGRISIRNQRTRWGSCSRHRDGRPGNLNFNYRIALLSPQLADYIIVHELCHIGEFNHSRNFWNLVALACPDFRQIRAELKKKKLRLG